MTDDAQVRKLATIVALDVAGYSARTEADEARTTAEVAALRKVIEGIAAHHAGRVFNTAGDGFMLEFASSLAAVEAALELAEKCEPKVRVGVHLGDVVVQPNGDLLGHGVNVAARLMAQSAPGSALVSNAVRQTIRGPVAERLVSRGVLQLDKMAETVEAFALAGVALSMIGVAPPTVEPVLAVLPFDNLSDDKDLQFFSDGISEEILQALARGSGLRVVARTSAFQFRGPRKAEAARLLRATHILDGTVRKAGSHLRVSAELSDAGGTLLWSERYDQDLVDVFALQDDVAAKVAVSLRSVLQPTTRAKQIDPRAYELYLKAFQERSSVTPAGFQRAQALLEEVVALAPEFSDAWALLGTVRTMRLPVDRDDIGTPEHSAALAATQRALALDPNCAIAFWNLAGLKPAFSDHGEKIALARRGLELAPNNSHLAMVMQAALIGVGRCRDGFAHTSRAAALDPMNPMNAAAVTALLDNFGRTADAHAYLDEVSRVQPPTLWTSLQRFWIFFNASRFEEAAAWLDKSVLSNNDELREFCRFMLALPALQPEARAAALEDRLTPKQDRAIALVDCGIAVQFRCADLAFKHLFAALDTGRPIAGSSIRAIRGTRGGTLTYVFVGAWCRAFRADVRFAQFCARVGLVDYWRASGHWPDCASEVPYDFKAECEKAAREVAKP